MDAQAETPSGVPDGIVRYTASCMVDAAYRYVNKKRFNRKYIIWLKDARVEVRGLGVAPELLKSNLIEKNKQRSKLSYKILRIFKNID
jgi:hypothetical protein